MMDLKDFIKKSNTKIRLSWHPEKEITISDYENMVTGYVQNYIERYNAQRISTKKKPFRF